MFFSRIRHHSDSDSYKSANYIESYFDPFAGPIKSNEFKSHQRIPQFKTPIHNKNPVKKCLHFNVDYYLINSLIKTYSSFRRIRAAAAAAKIHKLCSINLRVCSRCFFFLSPVAILIKNIPSRLWCFVYLKSDDDSAARHGIFCVFRMRRNISTNG